MRQLIIARKDLNMSVGKLSSQVSHASMAFICNMIKKDTVKIDDNKYQTYGYNNGERIPMEYTNEYLNKLAEEARKNGETKFYAELVEDSKYEKCEEKHHYLTTLHIDNETYEDWICGIFTKTICAAKNKNHLLKVIDKANELGLKENIDYFLIKDNCLTELEPEEIGDDGIGRTLTCIGFRPLPDEISHQLSKKYQLYK